MEQLLEHSNGHDRDVTIEFTYEGYLVRVRSGGEIRIVADA
ncbi:HalOD1 output domain-containing protein [Natrinema zhouii]